VDSAVLWADAARDVGVRFRVTEKDIRGQHPVLVASDEQLPVAYRLEFEELVVRSSTLLAMVEKSEVQQVAAEGKAIVLAVF
jgi:fructose-specific phosphotransferase system component IIB